MKVGWLLGVRGLYVCVRVGQVKSPAAAGTATSSSIDTDRLGHRPLPMTPQPSLLLSSYSVTGCGYGSLMASQVWIVGVSSYNKVGWDGRVTELWKGDQRD